MPIKLKNLLIDRVDLVDKGDNPEAHIALFKRRDEVNTENDAKEALKWFTQAVKKLFETEGDETMFDFQKFLTDLQDETLSDKYSKLSKGTQEKVSKAVEEAEEDSRKEVLKSELAKEEDGNGGGGSEVDRLKAEIARLKEQLNKNKPEPEPKDEDVFKGLPESVRKMIEDSNKRAEEAERTAKRLEDEKNTGVYVEKARSFGHVITDAPKVGSVLKRIADVSKEDYDVLEATFKAAEEALSKSEQITKEFGSTSDVGGDVWTKVELAAKKLMEQDTKLHKEQAIAKVLKDEPSLYAEYQKEINEEV